MEFLQQPVAVFHFQCQNANWKIAASLIYLLFLHRTGTIFLYSTGLLQKTPLPQGTYDAEIMEKIG